MIKNKSFRKDIKGTTNRPRLSIYKSYKHIYIQFINDNFGHTIYSFNTLCKINLNPLNLKLSFFLGVKSGLKLLQLNIKKINFINNNYKYSGNIRAILAGIKSVGIIF